MGEIDWRLDRNFWKKGMVREGVEVYTNDGLGYLDFKDGWTSVKEAYII